MIKIACCLFMLCLMTISIHADETDFTPPSIIVGRGEVVTVAFNPSGTHIAVATFRGVWIYAYPDLADVRHFPAELVNNKIVWSPDGRYIAINTYLPTENIVWDVTTGERLPIPDNFVGQMAWSADSRYLASGNRDHDIIIWDITTRTVHQQFMGDSANIQWVRWSPDEAYLFAITADDDGQVWDIATGTVLYEFEGEANSRHITLWSPDGSQVVIIHPDKMDIYHTQTGTLRLTITADFYSVVRAKWSPDNRYLIVEDNWKGGSIWDMQTGEAHDSLSMNATWHEALMWSSDNQFLAVGIKNTIQILDGMTNTMRQSFTMPSITEITTVQVSPDNQSVLMVGDNGVMTAWDLVADEGLAWRYDHSMGYDGLSFSGIMAWSPDARYIAVGGRVITIWDVTTGDLTNRFIGHTAIDTKLIWSPNGECLLSANDTETIIWRIDTGVSVYHEPTEWRGYNWYPFVAWTGGIDCIATDENGRVILIDPAVESVAQREETQYLLWQIRPLTDYKNIVFISLLNQRNFGRANRYRLELPSRREVIQSDQHTAYRYDYSSDRTRLAFAEQFDDVVTIQDTINQTVIATLPMLQLSVESIKWSPDDRYLFTQEETGTYGNYRQVQVWDTTTWQLLMTLDTGSYARGYTAWSPDGRAIASIGYGMIQIWQMPRD